MVVHNKQSGGKRFLSISVQQAYKECIALLSLLCQVVLPFKAGLGFHTHVVKNDISFSRILRQVVLPFKAGLGFHTHEVKNDISFSRILR